MRRMLLILALSALSLAATTAQAARLSCTNPSNTPNTRLTGFNFTVQVLTSAGGGGAGVGKEVSSLVVQVPLDATYAQLVQLVASGRVSSSCVLADTTPNAGHIEITLTNATFSQIQLLNGPNFTSGRPETVVQLTLTYSSFSTSQTP